MQYKLDKLTSVLYILAMTSSTTTSVRAPGCGELTQRDRRNLRWYLSALLGWAIAYMLATFLIRRGWVQADAVGAAVALLPSLIAIAPAMAFVRFLREADELQRLIELQALALGVGAAFIVFPCAQLLERLGFTLAAWRDVVPMVFVATYSISAVLGHRRYR
jgi:hypothetical protein